MDKLQELRNLGSDKFTIEMFQEDTGDMVSIITMYLSDGISKDILAIKVSVYADKVTDVRNYIDKWEQRVQMFSEVIEHMQTENFTNCMPNADEGKKKVYTRYLPVVQVLYQEKSKAIQKVEVAKKWLDAYTIIVKALEG